MEFIETKNDRIEAISKIKMNLDGILANDIPEPLPNKSGFNLVINGYSGSGKTNLLINILHRRAKDGKRQSLRKVFDSVIIVSPTLKSLANNIFEDLEDKKKFTKFDDAMLDGLEQILDEMKEKEEEDGDKYFTLLILDDVGSQIKNNKRTEARFSSIVQNRRHLGSGCLSIISIVQKHKNMPISIRSNLTHYITFLPKNQLEKESIFTEYVSLPKKHMNDFFNFFFQNKFDNLLIDMSSPPFKFYRNFNKVEIVKS